MIVSTQWLYSTRGSAVLYVKKELQPLIFPVVISRNYEDSMQRQFGYQGVCACV